MDIQFLVERIEALVVNGRKVPMTSQVILEQAAILDLIDQLRVAIPEEVKQARRINQESDRVLSKAREEAEQIIGAAQEQAALLLQDQSIIRQAETRSQDVLDKAQAAAALLGDRRPRVALEVHAGVRVCRDDVGIDARCARLGQAGVLTARVDGRFRELVVGLRADRLLQQRRDVYLHFALPSGCYRTRGACPCGSARRSSRTSRLFLMTESVFTRSLSSRTRTSAAY